MKKTKKWLRLEELELIVTEEHPKDVSRARLRVIDSTNGGTVYPTSIYGEVEPTRIRWPSVIELPFQAQQSLQFETICEHEYGYELQQLRALYSGVLYLRPDQFFFINSTHCLNQQGRQCGTLRFMPKIVEREETTRPTQVQATEPVKVTLVGRVSLYAGLLIVNPYHSTAFHKRKRRDLKLQLVYGKERFQGQLKQAQLQYRWLLTGKFEVIEGGPEEIEIVINQDGKPFLTGELPMATLELNRRFTVQVVQLTDNNGEKIAAIQLDLRYISKKELLDLMYSPKQLAGKSEVQPDQPHFHPKVRSSSVAGSLASRKKKELQQKSLSRMLELEKSRGQPSRRQYFTGYYSRAHLLSDKHESSIPRSRRFPQQKSVNKQVSYVDPSFLSDFSPKLKGKGATQSSTNKTDFTKHLKANPGVGEYHLPSIWEKV